MSDELDASLFDEDFECVDCGESIESCECNVGIADLDDEEDIDLEDWEDS